MLGLLSGFLLGLLQFDVGGWSQDVTVFHYFAFEDPACPAVPSAHPRSVVERNGRADGQHGDGVLFCFLGRGPLATRSGYRICDVTANAVVACYVYLQLGAAAFCASDVPEASKSFSYHAPRPAC